MRPGEKVQYNKKYDPEEVVLIHSIEDGFALIEFPSGTKIVTRLSLLCPLTVSAAPLKEHYPGSLSLFGDGL